MRACVCSDQQSVWQEGSQMLIKNLLHPPQWQWDYEANAPFHTYPSSWSGEVEEKMALQTLSSALLCPSNTHTEQPVCMQSPSNWCQNGALSPFLTEYLSNSLKLSVCLKTLPWMQWGESRVRSQVSAMNSRSLLVPTTTKGAQRNSLTYRIPRGYWTSTSLKWLQQKIPTYTLAISPPQEDVVLRYTHLINTVFFYYCGMQG